MRFGIQYISRRRWCYGVDVEDQAWLRAESEQVEGSVEDADVYARDLDAIFDHQFIHRAVPLPTPEPEPELAELQPGLTKCVAPLADRRAS
jgi:hypothetical protein